MLNRKEDMLNCIVCYLQLNLHAWPYFRGFVVCVRDYSCCSMCLKCFQLRFLISIKSQQNNTTQILIGCIFPFQRLGQENTAHVVIKTTTIHEVLNLIPPEAVRNGLCVINKSNGQKKNDVKKFVLGLRDSLLLDILVFFVENLNLSILN